MTLEALSPRDAVTAAVPRHVALIMDGNGRWAERQGRARLEGHQAGTENIRRVIATFQDAGVRFLTLYAFSTENWGRPAQEVEGLLRILHEVIGQEAASLHRRGVRIRHLGSLERLPRALADAIRSSVKLTQQNIGLQLCVAFDYGGRAELVDAVRAIVASGVAPEAVTEETIRAHLYLPDVPDPDLIIRTAGEQRISNFLIWQAAYAEFYQTPVCWPDFDPAEVSRALDAYSVRKRRFGRLP
ncbi:MAG: polyprenyl diphosphate synthase [Chloroflexota bacterium]